MKAVDYTSSADYAVLTNRFKLLNLVQRVAHRDVLEMIETVGLDAVTSKGTLERWQPGPRAGLVRSPPAPSLRQDTPSALGDGARRARASPSARRTQLTSATSAPHDRAAERFTFTRGTSQLDAKAAAARLSLNISESGANADPPSGAIQQGPARRRPRAMRRTPSEEAEFYDRLAAPRERPEDVFVDHVEVMEPDDRAASVAPRRTPPSFPSRLPRYARTSRPHEWQEPGGYPPYSQGPRRAYGPMTTTPPPLPRGHSWSAYTDDRGDDNPRYYYDDEEAMPPQAYNDRDGTSGEPPRWRMMIPEPQIRRVRFNDDKTNETVAERESRITYSRPPVRDARTSPLSPEQSFRGTDEAAHVLPAVPRRTDSEDSAPGSVRGTAPRNPSGLPDATTDNGSGHAAPSGVPPLQLNDLESPGAATAASNEGLYTGDDAAGLSGVEDETTSAMAMSTASGGAVSGNAVTRRQRAGGLRAKAKPRGALDSPRVPMDAIHHAASALLAQSHAARSQAALHSQSVPTADRRREGYQTAPVSDHRQLGTSQEAASTFDAARSAPHLMTTSMTPQSGLPRVASPVPVVAGTADEAAKDGPRLPPAAFAEVSHAIDHMLLDHQRILNELVRPERACTATDSSGEQSELFVGDAATMDISYTRPRQQQIGRYTALSRDQQREIMQTHLLGDGSLDEDEDDVADEMLLYARLQRKVASMDADLARIEHATATEERHGVSHRPTDFDAVATTGGVGGGNRDEEPMGAVGVRQTDSVVPAQVPRRRTGAERGVMPEAAIRRLQAFRKENYEHIAYNEKLWNTSQVSQFAFAQRLTNALTEDCFNEVMSEVGTIMDDYVEGLADHELR